MSSEQHTDWQRIASELGVRVEFAIFNLKGSGFMMDPETGKSKTWREYLAEGLDLFPGYSVDREIMATLDMPRAKGIKARAEIQKKRLAMYPQEDK